MGGGLGTRLQQRGRVCSSVGDAFLAEACAPARAQPRCPCVGLCVPVCLGLCVCLRVFFCEFVLCAAMFGAHARRVLELLAEALAVMLGAPAVYHCCAQMRARACV